MSGRITQYRNPLDYTRQLGMMSARLMIPPDVPHPRYNVGPGTCPFVIFADATVRLAKWEACDDGPARALPAAVAEPRLAPLWRAGRMLVPLDGWYAPHDAQGRPAPCYVRPRNGATLYLPALSGASCAEDEDACFTPLCHEPDPAAATGAIPYFLLDARGAACWLDRRVCFDEAQRVLTDNSPIDPAELDWRTVTAHVNADSPDSPRLIRVAA